jgi:hypothetical protein
MYLPCNWRTNRTRETNATTPPNHLPVPSPTPGDAYPVRFTPRAAAAYDPGTTCTRHHGLSLTRTCVTPSD